MRFQCFQSVDLTARIGDCVEERSDGKNEIGLDRAEDYRPEPTPPSQGLVQHVLSDVIDPALANPEGKSCCHFVSY
jgi:hypothetical protein